MFSGFGEQSGESARLDTSARPLLIREARQRVVVARARWRDVMFKAARSSQPFDHEWQEREEALARQEMMQADIALFRLTGPEGARD